MRSQFAITIYYNGSGYDSRTRRAKGLTDRWLEVHGWADERLEQQILADQIDILIDLSGHTAKNRLPLFARHPAPLQLTLVAYPHSTGLDSIDYFIGDTVLTPPAMAHLYSEQLLRLEHCIFNYPPELHPLPQPQAPREVVVFGSFNNVPKLTPTTVRLWAEVLKAVPQSRLLLKAPSFQDSGCCDRYRQLFAVEGVGSDRIEFRGPTGIDEMMVEYGDIDIALDPTPFNGGTTSQQALLAGRPLVTLAGESFNQRMGASILTHLGYPEWVATTADAYVAIAVALANDQPRLQQLHQQLPQQVRHSSLCDNQGYTRDLEHHYREIWQQWCARQPQREADSNWQLQPLWQQVDAALAREILDFWIAEQAFPEAAQAQGRARQAVLLARQQGRIIGIVTAERVVSAIDSPHYLNGRIYIQPQNRQLKLLQTLLSEAFVLLQQANLHQKPPLAGVLLCAENRKWMRKGSERWLQRQGYRIFGHNLRGEAIYLRPFDNKVGSRAE